MCRIPENYLKEVNENIAVNQIAYGVSDKKIAILKGDFEGVCYLCEKETNKAVFEAKLSLNKFDATNAVYVKHFDFTDFKQEGKYYIATEKGVSFPF